MEHGNANGEQTSTTFLILDRGGEMQVEKAERGHSLMEALRDLGRVDAICGGSMSCGTCAVRVAAPWCDRLEPECETERMLLEGLGLDERGCRLSCQIAITEGLDGIVVEVLQGA